MFIWSLAVAWEHFFIMHLASHYEIGLLELFERSLSAVGRPRKLNGYLVHCK